MLRVTCLTVLLSVGFMGSLASADVAVTSAKPTPINVQAAMKSTKSVAKCTYQKMGETGRYKNVKGSSPIFTATLPKEDTKAVDAISNGQAAWVCKSMVFNKQIAKFVAE